MKFKIDVFIIVSMDVVVNIVKVIEAVDFASNLSHWINTFGDLLNATTHL